MSGASGKRQRERYLKAGLVQINAWIPKDKAREILEDCARLRWEHLLWVERQQEEKDNGQST